MRGDASIVVEVVNRAAGRFRCTIAAMTHRPVVEIPTLVGGGRHRAGPGGDSHARRENTYPTGRRRDPPGRLARHARRTAQAPGRAALSLPLLRAQPGVLPRRPGDVD